MKQLLSPETQDPVSRLSHYRLVAGVVIATAAVIVIPDVALATINDSATSADGLGYMPKLIKDQMAAGGTALMAIAGGVLAAAMMSITGPTVPKVGGGLAVGAVAGYGYQTVVGVSGSAIV